MEDEEKDEEEKGKGKDEEEAEEDEDEKDDDEDDDHIGKGITRMGATSPKTGSTRMIQRQNSRVKFVVCNGLGHSYSANVTVTVTVTIPSGATLTAPTTVQSRVL